MPKSLDAGSVATSTLEHDPGPQDVEDLEDFDGYDDDDSVSDAGMFSFARPSTAEQPASIPFGRPSSIAQVTMPIAQGPRTVDSSQPTGLNMSKSLASLPPDVIPIGMKKDSERSFSQPEVKVTTPAPIPALNSGFAPSVQSDLDLGFATFPSKPHDTLRKRTSNDPSRQDPFSYSQAFSKGDQTPIWKEMSRQSFRLAALQYHGESNPGDHFADTLKTDTIINAEEEEVEEDSLYAEVRASVSNTDDTTIPALTFRSWFLGLFLTVTLGTMNTFLAFRYPSPSISPLVTLILAYPLGKLLAAFLPIRSWSIPSRLGLGDSVSFNPGPFSQKEHAVIVMMANIALTPPYALNFCVATEVFYNIKFSFLFDFLLATTTSMLGFGAAGLYRRFLVWPASLLWPQNLLLSTLMATFHAEEDSEPEAVGIPRLRMFTYVFAGATLFYLLPGYLFQALSVFSYVCWIAPQNVIVNQLFGVGSGLGLSLLTFDWSQIAFFGSPLIVPSWAAANIIVCFVVLNWILAPALYYSGVWSLNYLPISTGAAFDRYGHSYNLTRIFDSSRRQIDVQAYQEYSPLFVSATYACAICAALALLPATLTHTIIYHGKDILEKARGLQNERQDIHMKLMRKYPEVPDWVYAVFGGIALGFAMLALWPTLTPWWTILLACAFGTIFLLPAGFVCAMTTEPVRRIDIYIALLLKFVLTLMFDYIFFFVSFKSYAVTTTIVGLSFVQDLKLGHYMKIPPRTTFLVQVVAVLFACFSQVCVKRWLVSNVPDFCSPDQAALLVCPTTHVYFTASMIWGAIGPARLFGPEKQYSPMLYSFIIGTLAPIIPWLLAKRWPNTWISYISLPVAINGALFAVNARAINMASWFIVNFLQSLIRKRHFGFWSKYIYLISGALDSGTTVSAIFIFLALQLPKNGNLALEWWGNTVFKNTLDFQGVSYLTPPDEGFGPANW